MTHRAWSYRPLAELSADELKLVLSHVRRLSPDDVSMELAIINELTDREPDGRYGEPRVIDEADTVRRLPHADVTVLNLSLPADRSPRGGRPRPIGL